jgi:hypothetical protein
MELAQRVEKSATETLVVTNVDISECVTEIVSVNLMDKSDGGNAP